LILHHVRCDERAYDLHRGDGHPPWDRAARTIAAYSKGPNAIDDRSRHVGRELPPFRDQQLRDCERLGDRFLGSSIEHRKGRVRWLQTFTPHCEQRFPRVCLAELEGVDIIEDRSSMHPQPLLRPRNKKIGLQIVSNLLEPPPDLERVEQPGLSGVQDESFLCVRNTSSIGSGICSSPLV
jgi:hypothetical protein